MNEDELDLLLSVQSIVDGAAERNELREGLVGAMVFLENLRDRVRDADGPLSADDRRRLVAIVNRQVDHVWTLLEETETG